MLRSMFHAAAVAAAMAAPDPSAVVRRAISQLVSQPYSADLWSWAYGPAIQMSTMYQVSSSMGQNWTRSVDSRLQYFNTNTSEPGYQVLNNITVPWGYAIGDVIGLMPIAYLSRFDYYNESASQSTDWTIATRIADEYILQWPHRLPDGTISRDSGWSGQPDNNASFLWCDDQFMGTTLLARLAAHNAPNTQNYVDFIAQQQVQFASYMQNTTSGIFLHGYNHATNELSCCAWGRANGWVMMSHAEIVPVLSKVAPNHPLLPAIIEVWKSHAAGIAALQQPEDGRWHQVLDHPETFLETSATAMFMWSYITGVMGGFLDRETYDPVIQLAWQGLAGTVAADGTVNGICTGTGIGTSVEFYQDRPTDYAGSAPGLGSVFRAALAYYEYMGTQ